MSGDGWMAEMLNPSATRAMALKLSSATSAVLTQTRTECAAVAKQFGFSHYYLTLSTMVPPGVPLRVRVDHTPPGFRGTLDAHCDTHLSPLWRQAMSSVLPFALHEVDFDRALDSITLLDRCRSFGLADGLVVPLHGPRCSHGVLLLLDDKAVAETRGPELALHSGAHWACTSLLHRLTAEIERVGQKNKRRQLTPRQRQAVLLASQGQTLAEIANALSVHTSTARYLIARAVDKLGVSTRFEAMLRIAAIDDFIAVQPPAAELHHQGLLAPVKTRHAAVTIRTRDSSLAAAAP